MSEKTKNALIGATATVLAAIITGAFLLVSKFPTNTSSATATGGSPITSNLTVTASPNPYPPYTGMLVLDNPLHSPTSNWEESGNSTDPGTCKFTADDYYASQSQPSHYTTCLYEGDTFMNFAFEVGMLIVQGN